MFSCFLSAEPDSIFIYSNGEQIFKKAAIEIDSLTFLPLNHYKLKNSEAIFGRIKSKPELGIFTKMLEITGYDKLIDASTIWVPDNRALKDVDLNDTAVIKKIVQLHINRQKISTKNIVDDSVYVKMINKKNLIYRKTPLGYTFDDITVIESDIVVADGIIHILDGQAKYIMNLWEYLNQMTGADSMKSFIQSLNRVVYDPQASYRNDVLVDSVFTISNDIMNYLGKLDSEDSTYTVLVPDDTAWKQAYDSLLPFYPVPPNLGGLEKQIENTKWVILRELIHKGISNIPKNDSIYGNLSAAINCTNGILMTVSQLNQFLKPQKEILIEAENERFRGNTQSYLQVLKAPENSKFDISNNEFIRCHTVTTSTYGQSSVLFRIPNILASEYDIYAVFVPTCIIDSTDLRPFRMAYYITYINEKGIQVKNETIKPENNLTNPISMTKVLIAKNFRSHWGEATKVEYPYPSVTIKIENDVRRNEETHNRNFQLDYIILEPAKE